MMEQIQPPSRRETLVNLPSIHILLRRCIDCGRTIPNGEDCVPRDDYCNRFNCPEGFRRHTSLASDHFGAGSVHASAAPSPSLTFVDTVSMTSEPGTPTSEAPFDSRTGAAQKNDNEKAERKRQNECLQRKVLSEDLQTLEDELESLCGITTGNPQYKSNGASSGLSIKKHDLLNNGNIILAVLANERLEHVLQRGGTLEQHHEEMRALFTASKYPGHGTCMDDGNAPPCTKKKGSQKCETHREKDWRVCRRGRKGKIFKDNIRHRQDTIRKGLTNLSRLAIRTAED